ncbi:MAG: hypothetical protein ACLP2Y_06445 [Limisphaerales bacterium]
MSVIVFAPQWAPFCLSPTSFPKSFPACQPARHRRFAIASPNPQPLKETREASPSFQCIRLTEYVWFPALDYEIVAAWIHQKLDQDGGADSN